jgi:hypothetical protein
MGCAWLDTLKVSYDDTWIKPATFGQRFGDDTKIKCVLAGNTLHFTLDSRVTWSMVRLPIHLAENKFGQGRITYQHPMTCRDTLCPILAYSKDDNLYGIVMNNANFQLVAIKDSVFEVLAAGYHFNLPGRAVWDHSAPPCEIDYVDTVSKTVNPTSLLDKISGMLQSIISSSEITEPNNGQTTDPTAFTAESNAYLDTSHLKDNTQIDHIEFTLDLSNVFISYKSGTYVYKAKMSYREVGELVDTMDCTLAGLGIELPAELISDIACTVAEPVACLDVKDIFRVPMRKEELEFKAAVCENDRINDKEAKVKKANINIPPPENTRTTKPSVKYIKYNIDPNYCLHINK